MKLPQVVWGGRVWGGWWVGSGYGGKFWVSVVGITVNLDMFKFQERISLMNISFDG